MLGSLQGQEPLDIKAVAGRTGLSQQTASYKLKKLAGKGLLAQSSVAGALGRPKVVFAVAGNGQATKAAGLTNEAAGLEMSETTVSAPPKRKARNKARRGSKAASSAPAS